jgi:hypothetical protein
MDQITIFNSKLLVIFSGKLPFFRRFLRLAVVVAHRSPVEAKEIRCFARRIVGFFGWARPKTSWMVMGCE